MTTLFISQALHTQMLDQNENGDHGEPTHLEALRQNALQKLGKKSEKLLQNDNASEKGGNHNSLDLKMAQRLIEELQVYQVELEMQNDELRRVQQNLELSRDQYAELYHDAPVGYLTLQEDGRIAEVNRTASSLLQVAGSSMIDRPFSKYVARIDSNRYFDFLNEIFNETPIGESVSTELRVRCAGRGQNYVALTGALRVEHQTGKRLCRLVLQDIEDRKKMEERQRLLQAAVEYSTDGISISDMRELDSPIIYASPKLEELSGYSSDELVGVNWRMLYHDEPDESAKEMIQEAFAQGKECRTYVRNIRKDGTPFYCEVTLYPIMDNWGAVTHYVSVIRDITEKRKTDQAILQAQRLDSIGVLAGGIAHDFNNILHGVMVQSTLALRQLEDAHPAKKHIAKAHQATERAADLTRQLLSYAGRGNFEVSDLDVNRLIDETSQLVSSTIPSDITIEMDLSAAPLFVEGNKGQIQQVVLNLVMNAAEAIEGKGKIEVRSMPFQLNSGRHAEGVIQNGSAPGQLLANKRYVLIEVEDSGCGISRKTIEKIFDPFFTTKETGHGLGLAAALGVVRTHNGLIQAESRVGMGTKFSVFLPLIDRQMKADKAPSAAADDGVIPGCPTILIVDDDPNVRDTLDSALDFLGCNVISASNGAEGIDSYRLHWAEIDLVLMDFHMPGMDGDETFAQLQSINPELRCVFSSGFAPDQARKQIGHGDGRINYLQKPYDLPTLRQVIVSVLGDFKK